MPVTREYLVAKHTIPLSDERLQIDKDTALRKEYKVRKREVSVRRERLLIDDAQTQTDE